jgi:hypothetical protein
MKKYYTISLAFYLMLWLVIIVTALLGRMDNIIPVELAAFFGLIILNSGIAATFFIIDTIRGRRVY